MMEGVRCLHCFWITPLYWTDSQGRQRWGYRELERHVKKEHPTKLEKWKKGPWLGVTQMVRKGHARRRLKLSIRSGEMGQEKKARGEKKK